MSGYSTGITNITALDLPIAAAKQQPPGHYYVETPVVLLANGQQLTFATHILRGTKPGPTVGILSGLHGDEFSTAELVLSLVDLIDLGELAGTLLLVPMANALSFETATRSTTIDAANLNRVFPGNPKGTVTEMLAYAITEHFIKNSDVIFDLHSEPDTMNIRCFYSAKPVDAYGEQALALSKASGSPIIFTTKAIGGSLGETAQNLGILAVMPETGGPLPGAEGLMPEAQSEILNMLRHLQVIPGTIETPSVQVIVDTLTHLRAPMGGLFRPVKGFEITGAMVPGGELLGVMVSPFTGEQLAELRSPYAESWILMARGRTSRVHPGDPLYIIGRAAAS